jgi:DNA-binding PucR family transcriptional regulator
MSALSATSDRAVPALARELAARLSELFERGVEIVERLNDAQRRVREANERLRSGLSPDAFGLIYDDAAVAAVGSSQVAALTDGARDARTAVLGALGQIHWSIHRGFCEYQAACEERRGLAVEVGELSQQLTDVLCGVGWSEDDAREANVHELARPAIR